MNLLIRALTAVETPGYAWKITKDHLARTPDEDEAGTSGPGNASEHHMNLLKDGEGEVFKMYDDDGELYYTGRLVFDDDMEGTEEACYGPLSDFGMPNAGCTEIRYPRKPEWNCG